MNKVILVGGGKGGVGKSTVTMALLDTLLEEQHAVVLVESDDSNPDTYKAMQKIITCEICNLDAQAGYITLGEIIERNSDASIVVNTAARATGGIIEHGDILKETCAELGRDLVMVWPINRQRDSLELLKRFMDNSDGYKAVYCVLNTYFGNPEKFNRYNTSKLKNEVTGTLELPELDDDITDIVVDNRLTLENASSKYSLTTAKKSALNKYRKKVHEVFSEVINGH
jgi:CO dehydrogenase nickel-insertion accessory protein CooC1